MSKNKLWLDTKSIIIVILLILLFLLNKCKNNLKVEPITKVTTVVDTVTIIKKDTKTINNYHI